MLFISPIMLFFTFPATSNLVLSKIMGDTMTVVIILETPALRKLRAPRPTTSSAVLGFSCSHLLGILFLSSLSTLCSPVKKTVQLMPFLRIERAPPLKNPLSPSLLQMILLSFHSSLTPTNFFTLLQLEMLLVLRTSKGWVMTEVMSPTWKLRRSSLVVFSCLLSMDKIIILRQSQDNHRHRHSRVQTSAPRVLVITMLRISLLALCVALIAARGLLRLDFTEWEFKVPTRFEDKSYPAKIPSNLHLDLLENKLIEDPFFRDNHNSLKWIHDVQAHYQTKFKLPAEWKGSGHLELVFEGLDTYANISLNGVFLRSTNNSFIKYVIPVSNLKLNNEENVLEIVFSPSKKVDDERQGGTRLPFAYGHSRKAPYQYGWDWAPELITVGVWRPAYILGFERARIDYVWARNRLISEEKAIINFATVLHSHNKSLSSLGKESESFNISVLLEDRQLSSVICQQWDCYVDVEIPQPKLWWPRNVGIPHVYNFSVVVRHNNEVIDSSKVPYGIRTIQLNQTDGAFQFIVNGYPVYAKGANYVPADMFHPRFANPVHKPAYTMELYFSDIVESNFNMIRIWGGGQYETDEFYEAASRNGIMLFSEFMYSVNTYPGSEDFLRNAEEEAKQQVRRLRNYPALALWSGNNEVLQGIMSWGWGSAEQRNFYGLLFDKLLMKIVEIENSDISYIPSSPVFGSGYDTTRGDIHYWGVWAAGSVFESYLTTSGRFNSEFGTQAFPVWETVKQFTNESERNYDNTVMKSHEKHNSQFSTLRMYIGNYFQPTNSFENEVYISGLVQAYAVKLAISAQRANKEKTWGTLYWQSNDAWPVISWASIDYYGRWKPLQYVAKNFYKDVALLIEDFDNSRRNVKFIAVNEKLHDVKALAKIKILTFDGKVLFNETKLIDLKPNEAKSIQEFLISNLTTVLNGSNTNQVIFFGEIISSKTNIMRNTFYLVKPKELDLQDAALKVSYHLDTNEIKLNTNTLIKNLYISHPDMYIKLSDNYMDIVPGVETVVVLKGLEGLKGRLVYTSVRQTYTTTKINVTVA